MGSLPACRKMAQISAPLLLQGLCCKQASIAPRHHLVGTQHDREWEIVSLKIGCPLLWLSPPSVPGAQGWRSSEKHPEKQQRERGGIFGDGGKGHGAWVPT